MSNVIGTDGKVVNCPICKKPLSKEEGGCKRCGVFILAKGGKKVPRPAWSKRPPTERVYRAQCLREMEAQVAEQEAESK